MHSTQSDSLRQGSLDKGNNRYIWKNKPPRHSTNPLETLSLLVQVEIACFLKE